MKIEAFLGGFVVIGRYQQAGICTDLLCSMGPLYGFSGRVCTSASNHGDPTIGVFDNRSDGRHMLLHIECRGFAGGTHSDNRIGPLGNMPLHQTFQTIPVNFLIIAKHGRNQSNNTAGDHRRSLKIAKKNRTRNGTDQQPGAQAL